MSEETKNDAALESLRSEIEALKATNKQLKDEKTAEKRKADEAQEARETAEREANEKSGDVEKIKADLKKAHDREIAKLTDRLTASEKREATYKIDGAISDAIAKAGVLPEAVGLATSYLRAGVTMENGEAVFEGAPLADRLTNYFNSPEARFILAAPANSGGGAQGSTGARGVTKKPETAEEWTAFYNLPADEQSAVGKTHGIPGY